MKFDAIHKSKKYRKFKRNKFKITCYDCENKDHYKNECKKQINEIRIDKPKQFNVINKKFTVCRHCKRIESHRSECVTKQSNDADILKTLTFIEKQSMLRTNEHKTMH